jgi:hypothetical protein
MAQAAAPILQLKVVLCGSRPPVWRRIIVPGNVTPDRFHLAAALIHERKSLGKYRQLRIGLMTDLLTDRMRVRCSGAAGSRIRLIGRIGPIV